MKKKKQFKTLDYIS